MSITRDDAIGGTILKGYNIYTNKIAGTRIQIYSVIRVEYINEKKCLPPQLGTVSCV